MRRVLVLAHRWVGLTLAGILVIAGLTGSIAAFHDTLDGWLNPDLFAARSTGPALPPSALAAHLAAQDPGIHPGYMLFRPLPGRTVRVYAAGREIFLDPATGTMLGSRPEAACCLSRRALIPFLYRFHYTLGLGRAGEWVMGLSSALWSLDCVVGLLLTLPAQPWRIGRWRQAWLIKRGAGGFRRTMDLHRATSLWLWIVLLGVAVSGVALSLERELFLPVLSRLLPVTPPPASVAPAPAAPGSDASAPDLDRLVALAEAAAARRGWHGAAGGLFLLPGSRRASVYFFRSDAARGIGLGSPVVTLDARTGTLVTARMPGQGRSGDLVLQAQFPWHSGQIAGLPGRILVACCGVAVAGLAVTGVMIWERKRRARAGRRARPGPAAARG